MKSLESAYSKLNDSNSDVSCHYLISRLGLIYSLLPPNYKGWHAGKSQWRDKINLNDYSIGIELENKGHDYGYNYFTKEQYLSLKKLVNFLITNYYIKDQDIIFHSDISPNRKKDPGEKFFISKIGLKRFKNDNPKKTNYSIKELLQIYGFSKYYIKIYKSECIKAVKRTLNYQIIDADITKKFKLDFYNLLF
tara:strand:- start:83 stop:661 length:579 start_codon:yes stop_codon:yes gene_type:complete